MQDSFTVVNADGSYHRITPDGTSFIVVFCNADGTPARNSNFRYDRPDSVLAQVPDGQSRDFRAWLQALADRTPPDLLIKAIGSWTKGNFADAEHEIDQALARVKAAILAGETLEVNRRHFETHEINEIVEAITA